MALFTATRTGDRLEDRRTDFYSYPDQLDAAISWALDESARGREVYFCAHLLTDRRRVKTNAAPVLTLWGDLDGEDIPTGELEPSAVVESSPGRFHCYWRLMDEIPPGQAEELNKRIARKIGADPSGFDLSQLLRVPGTTNHKRGEATAVELRYVGERRYTAEALDELLPPAETPEKPRRAAPSGPGPAPVQLEGRAREVFGGLHPRISADGRIDRSASLVKIGRVMFDAGADRPEIVAALRERDETLYRKYSSRADAEQRFHEIFDELERNGRNTRARLTAVPGGADKTAPPIEPGSYNLTDYGLAERLVHHHGDDLRHVFAWHRDLVYDGRRFALDETGEAVRRTKRTVRAVYVEAADEPDDGRRKALADFARKAEAKAKIDAALDLARSEPSIAITHGQLDADPYLLNVLNGTVDLTTGELREHRREDLITKIAPVEHDPAAEAPTWSAFLERVLPSEELRRFVQRVAGYALTGDVSEQALFFLYGTGSNGKSTLVNTLMLALGDYAKQAAPDLLVVKRGSHPTELADLFGARLVASTEVEDGRRLAEALIKQLTGGEPIRARRMREDFWQFPPTHKVLLSANHKPTVRGVDHAIWRRIKVIPFEVTVPDAEQDKRLPEKLRAEMPGILRWALDGCLDWQRHGLGEPPEVREATETYRAEQDVIGAFIAERCITAPHMSTRMKELYGSYAEWCEEGRETQANKRQFGDALKERGYEPARGTGNAPVRKGIGLRSDHTGESGAWVEE
jgi:putative DNA primase/helicase